jgi:hypothetical protein
MNIFIPNGYLYFEIERGILCSERSNDTQEAIMDLKTVQTTCNALNWIIARLDVSDISDEHGVQIIGSFVGRVPAHMRRELTAFGSQILSESDTHQLSVTITNGQYKSTRDDVQVYVRYLADR